ncbi:MAG: ABC transporter ATP-binding protein [Campylobacterota bacterium]|nr:ABC transporter ATP-binding protein [Campylobacterota bacterium]
MQNKPITIKTIYSYILDEKPALIIGQIISLLAILVSVPIPLVLPVMVDEILLDKPAVVVESIDFFLGSTTAFYYIAIAALAVVLLRFIYYFFTVVNTKIFTKIAKYATFMIRKRVIQHLEIVSMKEYETIGSGAITSNLVTDVNTLDNFIITGISKFIASILTLVAVAVVMIAIDPILGILILIVQPVIMLLSKKMSSIVGGLKKDENEAISKFQEDVGESLELFGQIKASNQESFFFSRSIDMAKKIEITSNEYSYKNVAYERLSYTIFLVMFELIRAAGLILVAYSDLSVGMMFAMFGYIWFIMTPVQDMLSLQYSYASAVSALERINTILALKTEHSGKQKIEEKDINIVIKNLDFSYSLSKEILKNISLNINSGCKIALIGASGSGKTTLAQIISGFYEKESGLLSYNGIETELIEKKSLRQKIFLVLQMPILFNSTLRFNITMGDESISDDEIYEALKVAQLYDTLQDMQDRLDTIVGHHGIRLSGGQRQRLSIARMIIADPSVVIFDESTSALDVHTEAKIQLQLAELLKEKTVITIAHRLSTVKNADKIYVLDEGVIVQSGTHKELEDEEGHYSEFIKRQLV